MYNWLFHINREEDANQILLMKQDVLVLDLFISTMLESFLRSNIFV
jgi:hypothetical protein